MKVLGIETATWVGSVAIVDNEGLIGEYTLNLKTTHSRRLLPALDHLLKTADLAVAQIDVLAVSQGPGSFTGLRIGASTVKGLALAAHKPVVGIPTLDALASHFQGAESLICPMLDARKKEVYAALYRSSGSGSLDKMTPDLAVDPEHFLSTIDGNALFVGDGSVLYRTLIEDKMGSKATFAPSHMHYPQAAAVAFLALEKAAAEDFLDVSAFVPTYARASDAERNKNITAAAFKNRDSASKKE